MQPTHTEEAAPPEIKALVDVPYRRKLFLVAALTVTLFVATMNQTVVATAAQNIVADIGGFALYTWLFAGFSLASAVGVPVAGKLSDLYGRKPVIIGSLGLFLIASAACGVAQDMPQLIVGRAFQGVSFAGVMGSVFIIMADLWAPEDRAKWIGVTTTGFTLSGILGPVIGGVVSDALTWRWIFFLNLPVGGLAFFLLGSWFPSIKNSGRRVRLDIAGAAAFATSATAALFALSTGGETFPWNSPIIIGLFGLSAVALVAFLWIEQRAEDPMIPLGLFRARIFTAAMVASFTLMMSIVAATVFLPLFIQGAQGRQATWAAVPLMFMAMGVAVGSNTSGQILARIGHPREVILVGTTGCVLALGWLGTIGPETSFIAIAAATFVLGVGVSAGFTSYTVPVQNAMPGNVLGVVTSSLQSSRVFGIAVGSAVLGALLLGLISTSGAAPGTSSLADPSVLVSRQQLAEIRAEYAADPELTEADFETDLRESRDNLADSLGMVFTIAAGIVAIGIVPGIIAFSSARGRSDEESEASREPS